MEEILEAPVLADTFKLTADEIMAISPSVKRIVALNAETKTLMDTVAPFLKLIAKNHGLDLDKDKYSLLPDCSAFVKIQ